MLSIDTFETMKWNFQETVKYTKYFGQNGIYDIPSKMLHKF